MSAFFKHNEGNNIFFVIGHLAKTAGRYFNIPPAKELPMKKVFLFLALVLSAESFASKLHFYFPTLPWKKTHRLTIDQLIENPVEGLLSSRRALPSGAEVLEHCDTLHQVLLKKSIDTIKREFDSYRGNTDYQKHRLAAFKAYYTFDLDLAWGASWSAAKDAAMYASKNDANHTTWQDAKHNAYIEALQAAVKFELGRDAQALISWFRTETNILNASVNTAVPVVKKLLASSALNDSVEIFHAASKFSEIYMLAWFLKNGSQYRKQAYDAALKAPYDAVLADLMPDEVEAFIAGKMTWKNPSSATNPYIKALMETLQ